MAVAPVPTIPTVEEIIRKVMPLTPVAKGTILATAKGWTKAFYSDPITGEKVVFKEAPTVVAVAEVRAGKPPTVTAPTINIPTVPAIAPTSITVPSIELPVAPTIIIPTMALPAAPTIAIPTVTLPTLPTIEVPVITIPHVTTSLGRFSCGWAISGLCDALNKLMGVLEGALRTVNSAIDFINAGFSKARTALLGLVDSTKKLRDNTQGAINTYRDNIQSAVNTGLADTRTKTQTALNAYRDTIQSSVNAGLADTRDKMQAALNAFRSRIEAGVNSGLADSRAKTQTAINDYRDKIQTAINEGLSRVIPMLYDQIGLPPDQLINSVNLRNVGNESFEFYSLGNMKLHYVAIGRR